ncbi:MAG: NAD(P)/FAD-dependent oxidoreductase [Verrucomicrobia bacterium]|nr:NAD(P)/FAD-dependent oxidoreductase [Verrucomicrobiota bacterium]
MVETNISVTQGTAIPPSGTTFDVIVMGGALAGASTALLLRRRYPRLRVLVVERSEQFTRRVGESTVEISAYFLTRVLGLTQYLNQHHLNKQGLRFWFHRKGETCARSCSEIGPGYNVRIPGYQVDRATLDSHILQLATEAGAHLLRPAEVKSVELEPGGHSRVHITCAGMQTEYSARWVVDATGTARFLGRKHGWIEVNREHPIASIWSRWRGVKTLDDLDVREQLPGLKMRGHGTRFTATNHLVGEGWWAWIIPLKGEETSIGIVYDERICAPLDGDKPVDKLRNLLCSHPLGKLLLSEATPDLEDMHYRKNLPYVSRRFVGDGFTLIGDAAGFIDPFYSPGMDWVSFGVCSTVHLIGRERNGRKIDALVSRLDEDFKLSYERWFQAIYRNKYEYMGDFDLMKLAFRLDLGLYYFGVVSQPYERGWSGLLRPAFSGPRSLLPYRLIRLYNIRLATIARKRRERGIWGYNNHGKSYMFNSYTLDWKLPLRITIALFGWLALELKEGWRSWASNLKTSPQ